MSRTPAFALVGLVLVVLAIPLALSIWPLAIGIVLLGWAGRRAHLSLADVGAQPAPGPAAAMAAPTPSA